jgi:hypothetical protein
MDAAATSPIPRVFQKLPDPRSANHSHRLLDILTIAFQRLAPQLTRDYPQLPLCLLFDAFYANGTVMDLCPRNHWTPHPPPPSASG